MGVIKELDIVCSEFLPKVCQECCREDDFMRLKEFMLSMMFDDNLPKAELYFNEALLDELKFRGLK